MNLIKKLNHILASKLVKIKAKVINIKWLKEIVMAIFFAVFFWIFLLLYWQVSSDTPDPVTVMILLISGCALFIFALIFIVSNRSNLIFTLLKRRKKASSYLRKRIIFVYSVGVALPAIFVAIFSIYFFNISVQTWFDDKVTNVLDQSVTVGESYVSEHIIQLKETSLSVADDLNQMYYDLIHNSELFSKVLNAQAEMRAIDEAIVFQRDTNSILAQTSFSFSLSFATIPMHLIERANAGEIVRVPSDKTKIRMLIKLQDYSDTYLLLGRLIDSKIIDHISETEGAVTDYKRLKGQIGNIQIKFSFVFIFVTLIIVMLAIIIGRNFTERLVRPIRQLVIATEKVKNGDLSVRVEEKNLKKDEIRVLSLAFNRMVQQIDKQQKELIVAQRALAWSDVARQVAHEIKNPLTPIQLSADRLLVKFGNEVKDKEAFKKYVDNIMRKSNDIKSIVSEFVNFARLPAPDFSKCNIVSYIGDIVEARKLTHEKITYKFIAPENDFSFICDIAQLNQIMENLLQNAEDALDEEGKNQRDNFHKSFKNEIKLIDPTIEIEIIVIDNKFLELSVSDNGNGFSPELLQNANNAYVTTKKKGTGLGLAIVEKIAQDHYGTMQIKNNSYGGATVKLNFDLSVLKEKF